MAPILLDFPHEFRTERLTIRCPMPGDGLAINEAVRESVDSFKPWFPFVQTVPTVEDSETLARKSYARFILREDLHLLLFESESGHLVGSSGLHRIDWNGGKFEIGYWLRDTAMGFGFATEAVTGITEFAKDHLSANRIEIRCDSRNVRSRRVAERCGFYLEATLKYDGVDTSGQVKDTLVYAKVRLANGDLGYVL